MTDNYRVSALWDSEAKVWVATSQDIPGLVTEAATLDILFQRVIAIAPELLDDNGVAAPNRGAIDLHIVSDRIGAAAE